MLPEVKQMTMPTPTFKAAWQTVIFRNYGYVRTERIAAVLGCDAETVEREAERLGLCPRFYAAKFEKDGYITVIRNNWFLLPYDQLLTLLGFSEARLAYVLDKDDFLAVKLGHKKPACEVVRYTPLSEDEKEETLRISETVRRYQREKVVHPFDFFPEKWETSEIVTAGGKRILHGYLSPCGDAFSGDCCDTLPDALLERYRAAGVNGIWLHAVLSTLSPYPFDPSLSEGYEMRRENLKKIVARCKAYGIGLYLYLNEPRALPLEAMPKYGHLVGWKARRTLCFEKREVREYLYEAVKGLCGAVPDLGGIFTITMSENATHCNFARSTECPVCANIPSEETASAVNNVIYRAMRDSGCEGELIANLWGWSPSMGWEEEQTYRGVALLERDISVMCVSEYDLPIEKGGVKGHIIDYSISNPGPSEITRKTLQKARELGHKTYAKIQASNSWECSAVPYLPVFDLVHEHMENLAAIGVEDHFLTWTVGGYPSPSVALTTLYRPGFDLNAWYEREYGREANAVHEAVHCFSESFREFPFSIVMLYNSPKTLGSANLWDLLPEEKLSSMVCYAFDDYERWMSPYPYEVYTAQFEKLLSGWEKGLRLLSGLPHTPKFDELRRYAEVAYLHWKSDLLQTRFAHFKKTGDASGMREQVTLERENAVRLLALMYEDARIGYEASNHYFYTERNLLEKILRMDQFLAALTRKIEK